MSTDLCKYVQTRKHHEDQNDQEKKLIGLGAKVFAEKVLPLETRGGGGNIERQERQEEEVTNMNVREMLSIIESFIAGFGSRSDMDINNAIFIAMELQRLSLPLDFKGAGRLGVESPKLYRILRDAKANQVNQEVFYIGRTFSEFKSSELMLMASYLWNEGKSSLDETEREEAITLLQENFGIPLEKGQIAKQPSVTASS